jgi:hypothetical protein
MYNCTCINNESETTTTTRPLEPVASALAPCLVSFLWDEGTLPNKACEMLAVLANIMARPLQDLFCRFFGFGLSVQLAQSILDLARRQAKRQESPIEVRLCLATIAWQAGSIEILTQNCSAIRHVTIEFRLPATDQGIVQRAQVDLLECLQNSTVKWIYLKRTPLPTNFLDAIGQEKLNRIVARNQMVPHLLLNGRYQLTDRSFCYLLPYALMVGAEHGHFFVLVAKWIAANDHRTRRPALSPPTSPSSEHADGSSQDGSSQDGSSQDDSSQDDNDTEFFSCDEGDDDELETLDE